jgi:hypothetical protein
MTKQPDQGWREHVLNNVLPRMEANTGPATGFTPAPTVTVPAQAPFSAGFPSPPSFDPLDALPPGAAERLRLLRQRSADAHAVIPEFEQIREASLARIEAENAVKRLTNHPQDFGFNLPETDARVVTAQKHLDKATDDFKRQTELQQVRTAAWQQASGALAGCEDWLRFGKPGNAVLEEVATEPPKMTKGETVLDAVERLRRRGRELRADLHRIASAPFPSSYSKQRLRQMVEQFAARGTPDVSALIEHDGDIVWPMLRVQSEVIGAAQRALAFHEAVDVVGLFACLLKPAMISFLDAMVDAEQDDAAALTHEQRQKAEAEVMGDLLAVEREECALVWQAQAQGLPCEHRSDISPLALLGLRLVTTPRAPDGPSSPERAGYNLIGGR